MAESQPQLPLSTIYSRFGSYPFAADPEFNAGLQSILATAPGIDDEQIKSKVELQARVYYFCRKFTVPPFSTDDYESWKSSSAGTQGAETASQQITSSMSPTPSGLIGALSGSASDPAATTETAKVEEEDDGLPRLTYAQLIELIQTGAPIPGIKDIPETVLSGQGSAAEASKRRKPWEREGDTGNDRDAGSTLQQQMV